MGTVFYKNKGSATAFKVVSRRADFEIPHLTSLNTVANNNARTMVSEKLLSTLMVVLN